MKNSKEHKKGFGFFFKAFLYEITVLFFNK